MGDMVEYLMYYVEHNKYPTAHCSYFEHSSCVFQFGLHVKRKDQQRHCASYEISSSTAIALPDT